MAYNPIKRIRDWFFDNNVPTEPRTFLDGNGNTITRQVKTRLAKGHFPKEETHKDLLASVFFKSAGSELQDVATTDDIKDELNVEKVVKPNQLPELEEVTDEITYIAQSDINLNYGNTFTGNVYNRTKRNNNGKNKYSWKFSKSFLGWLLTKLLPNGGTTGQILTKTNNSDFAVGWTTPVPTANQLPPFVSPNRLLFTNATNNAAEWRNRDYYTQTESNTLLSTEVNNRILGDTNLQTELNNTQIGAGLQPDGTYVPSLVSGLLAFATSLQDADDILQITLVNLSTLVSNMRNGAVLPQSSLAGLQSQIDALGGGNSVKTMFTFNSQVLQSTLGYWKKGNQVFIEGSIIVDGINSVSSEIISLNIPIDITPSSDVSFPATWSRVNGSIPTINSGIFSILPSQNLIRVSASLDLPVINNDVFIINITYLVS